MTDATTELAKAYHSFFSRYTLPDGSPVPAYPDGMVPDGAPTPYITYEIIKPAPFDDDMMVVRVWVESTSVTSPYTYIVDQVEASIPHPSGAKLRLPGNNASVHLRRGRPFSQDQPSDEANLKIRYINLTVTYYGIN